MPGLLADMVGQHVGYGILCVSVYGFIIRTHTRPQSCWLLLHVVVRPAHAMLASYTAVGTSSRSALVTRVADHFITLSY